MECGLTLKGLTVGCDDGAAAGHPEHYEDDSA